MEQQEQNGAGISGDTQDKPAILLIDLENCPGQLNELPHSLQRYAKVVVCYAATGARIPLDWLLPLNETINAGRLVIHKMEAVGKNAADFGLCFFAGMLAQQQHRATHFVIVSDDSDLDHVVGLLNAHSHTAERIGKQPVIQDAEPAVVRQAVSSYCAQLIKMNGSRPAKLEGLKNSIRSKMAQNIPLTEKVYQQLLSKQVISLVDDKVQYSTAKISALASD